MPYENGNGAAASTAIPPLGPNKIQQALDDYDHMVTELANVKRQLDQYTDISKSLRAENDILKEQLAIITAHRDRLNTALQGYLVRYRVIRRTIEDAEHEALKGGLMQETSSEPIKGAVGTSADVSVLPQNKLDQ